MDPNKYLYAATAPQQLPPAGQIYPPQQMSSGMQQGSFSQQPQMMQQQGGAPMMNPQGYNAAPVPVNGDLSYAAQPVMSAPNTMQPSNGTKAEGVHLSTLPPVLRDVLEKYDTNHDGILDHSEMMNARQDMAKMRQIVESGRVPMTSFPETARVMLEQHDTNGDGELDVVEIIHGFEALNREKRRKHQLMWFSTGLIAFSILLLIAVGGLMAYVIRLTKDTEVNGSVMYAKGTTTPIQTSASEFTVKNGMVVNRASECAEGQTCENPLKVSQAVQTGLLSSRLPDLDLQELKQLRIANGVSWIQFEVLAVARYAEDTSRYGTVVVIYTHIGELTLDGDLISFHEALDGAFSRAGFETVDSAIGARRRLLGVIETIGMFNFLTTILDADEATQNITSDFIATSALPFEAKVQQIIFCDKNSQQHCRFGGEYVDWVSQENGETVLQWTELQTYYNDGAGNVKSKTIKTSGQYPSMTSHDLQNGTHTLSFVVYGGNKYHCRVNPDEQLSNAVSGAASAVGTGSGDSGSAYTVVDKGVTTINGANVRHFTISGSNQAVDYYTKLDSGGGQRLYQLSWEHMAWRFKDLEFFLTLVPEDPSEFDFENPGCVNDPSIEAPPQTSPFAANAASPNPMWGARSSFTSEYWEPGLDSNKVEIALTKNQADSYFSNLRNTKCPSIESKTEMGAGVSLDYTQWEDCDTGTGGRRTTGNQQTFSFSLNAANRRSILTDCTTVNGDFTLHYIDADTMYTAGSFDMSFNPAQCFAGKLSGEMIAAIQTADGDASFSETFNVAENPVAGSRDFWEAHAKCAAGGEAQMGRMYNAYMFNTTRDIPFNNVGWVSGYPMYSLQGNMRIALTILSNAECGHCQADETAFNARKQTIALRITATYTGTINWNMCKKTSNPAEALPCGSPGASAVDANWGWQSIPAMKRSVFPGEVPNVGACQGGPAGPAVYRYQCACFPGFWDYPSCTHCAENDPLGLIEVVGTTCQTPRATSACP